MKLPAPSGGPSFGGRSFGELNKGVGAVDSLAEIVRHPGMASYLSCRLLARRLSVHVQFTDRCLSA